MTLIYYYQDNSTNRLEIDINEEEDERRARFQSYRNVELPRNWQRVDKNQNEIVFRSDEIRAQVTVTNTFLVRITGREGRICFEREHLTNDNLRNILQHVQAGTWRDEP